MAWFCGRFHVSLQVLPTGEVSCCACAFVGGPPRGDYCARFGAVVTVPQCVIGARRPSHRSSRCHIHRLAWRRICGRFHVSLQVLPTGEVSCCGCVFVGAPPRGDCCAGFGAVVAVPQCVIGARRPSHKLANTIAAAAVWVSDELLWAAGRTSAPPGRRSRGRRYLRRGHWLRPARCGGRPAGWGRAWRIRSDAVEK